VESSLVSDKSVNKIPALEFVNKVFYTITNTSKEQIHKLLFL